ncbi:MAG: hypothetical protein U5L09_05400 [Bacteroidales bacterium]|nr:hypothetical protein [Bacteroidales bacterium]
MKHVFTLVISIGMIIFLSTDAFSQVTHRATPGAAGVTETELPRVVRSTLDQPGSFTTIHQSERSAIDNKGTEFWLMMQRNYDTYVRGL